jgi:hypothetical protein
MLPARRVPVAPEVWGVEGHDDEVADALLDVVVAARAVVALGRLEGMDPADLDLAL